jgi:hypothetical protein
MTMLTNRAYFVIVAGILLVLTFPSFQSSLTSAQGLPQNWAATSHWIESAECARLYGKLLVGCPNGDFVPFAEISRADDPGHALLLGLYSMATGKVINFERASMLNTFINYSGISVLTALLFSLGLRYASIFALVALPVLANAYHSVSPHPAQFGVTLLISVLPIAVLGFDVKKRLSVVWIVFGLFALFIALLMRQSLGMIGIVACSLCLAASFATRKKRQERLAVVVTAFGVLLVSLSPGFLLLSRDAAYKLPPTHMIQSHGVWHNLYLGLGAVRNSMGIKWDDGFGKDLVHSIDPSVPYVSETYYRILRDQYFSTVVSHPIEVLRIYLEKLSLTIGQPVLQPIYPSSAWFLFPLIAAGILLRKRSRICPASVRATDAVACVSLLLAAAFLAQGALIHYDMQYMRPLGAIIVFGVCCIIEYGVSAVRSQDV